jgi:hypothetical protein
MVYVCFLLVHISIFNKILATSPYMRLYLKDSEILNIIFVDTWYHGTPIFFSVLKKKLGKIKILLESSSSNLRELEILN